MKDALLPEIYIKHHLHELIEFNIIIWLYHALN